MRGLLEPGNVSSCLPEHAFTTPFRLREAAEMAIRVVLGEDSFLAREAVSGVLERVRVVATVRVPVLELPPPGSVQLRLRRVRRDAEHEVVVG